MGYLILIILLLLAWRQHCQMQGKPFFSWGRMRPLNLKKSQHRHRVSAEPTPSNYRYMKGWQARWRGVRPLWVNYNQTYWPQSQIPQSWVIWGFIALLVFTGWAWNGQGTYIGDMHDRNYLNFPPPNAYKPLESGTAITMLNRVREPMTIKLTGLQNYEFRIEGCTDCAAMANEQKGAQMCDATGPSLTMAIAPGVYDARITFAGRTRGFKSQWIMQPQWEHYQCIFGSDEISF